MERFVSIVLANLLIRGDSFKMYPQVMALDLVKVLLTLPETR